MSCGEHHLESRYGASSTHSLLSTTSVSIIHIEGFVHKCTSISAIWQHMKSIISLLYYYCYMSLSLFMSFGGGEKLAGPCNIEQIRRRAEPYRDWSIISCKEPK